MEGVGFRYYTLLQRAAGCDGFKVREEKGCFFL
jgi:hypothetical protein